MALPQQELSEDREELAQLRRQVADLNELNQQVAALRLAVENLHKGQHTPAAPVIDTRLVSYGGDQHRNGAGSALAPQRSSHPQRAIATAGASTAGGGSIEILEYWRIGRKYLWLFVLMAGLSMVTTGFYTRSQPLRYSSTTTLFLNPAAMNPLLPFQSTKTVASMANTYAEFMRTHSFASLVVKQAGVPLSEGDVLNGITTILVGDTQFFRITAITDDEQTAQALAATAAKVLIAENTARQRAEQGQINDQINPSPERQQLLDLTQSLQEDMIFYQDEIKRLQGQIADLRYMPASDAVDKRIVGLQQTLTGLQTSRTGTLSALTQAQGTLNTATVVPGMDTAVVVDAAPLGAMMPMNLGRNMLLALALGLTVAAGIAFALEYLDYTVKTPEALETAYGIPTQGAISSIKGQRGKRSYANTLITLLDPHSPTAEAFRSLRTSVQMAGMGGSLRSLLITSAGPGEGKSFIAANLAISLAQNGSRVILVDADLRKPQQHNIFGISRETGLSSLIVTPEQRTHSREGGHHPQIAPSSGSLPNTAATSEWVRSEDVTSCLQSGPVPNLRLLVCGPTPPNPAELLGSARAAQVMDLLAQQADIVIYDSPPAATVTDAVVLAARVDGVLHVVRAGKTRINMIRRCRVMLEQVGGQILGPVLNDVQRSNLGYYGYYSYGYYHERDKQQRDHDDLPARG